MVKGRCINLFISRPVPVLMAVKYGACVLLLVILCSVRLGYRQYYGEQKCEMTYMWQWPRYQVRHFFHSQMDTHL